jgi:hypothetical protein
MPEGVVTVRINKETGCPATASDPSTDVMFEIFEEGKVPQCETRDDQVDIFNQSSDDSGDDRVEPIF